MSSQPISLKPIKDSLPVQTDIEAVKNKFQPFVFSKNWTRTELAKGFEGKAPAALVTALNVTRLAPAVFFALEKFTAVLQSLLNGGVSLLNSAYTALLGSHDVFELDIDQEPPVQKDPATPVKKDVKVDLTVPLLPTPPADIHDKQTTPLHEEPVLTPQDDDVFVEEPTPPLATPPQDTPVKSEPTPSPIPTTPVHEEPSSPAKVVEQPQPNPVEDTDDDLDAHNDLADVNTDLDGPALPAAPTSNKTRNLLIGTGITAGAAVAYVAACRFTNLVPNAFNIFGNATKPEELFNAEQEKKFNDLIHALGLDVCPAKFKTSPKEQPSNPDSLSTGEGIEGPKTYQSYHTDINGQLPYCLSSLKVTGKETDAPECLANSHLLRDESPVSSQWLNPVDDWCTYVVINEEMNGLTTVDECYQADCFVKMDDGMCGWTHSEGTETDYCEHDLECLPPGHSLEDTSYSGPSSQETSSQKKVLLLDAESKPWIE